MVVGGLPCIRIPDWRGYWARLDGIIVSTRQGEPRVLGQSLASSGRAHHRTGHLRVRLRRDEGGYRDLYVHVLVCRAFNGPPPHGLARPMVLHLDDDPHNNTPWNLQWGSERDNAVHRAMPIEQQNEAARTAWARWIARFAA